MGAARLHRFWVQPRMCGNHALTAAAPRRYACSAKSYKVLIAKVVDMRTTKVYSITMPPDMAKQAERLAKKENRTMSELMREAFRRYVSDSTRQKDLDELKLAVTALREEARQTEAGKLTKRQLDNEIA